MTLPADGANGVDPCIAFSVGVDADTEKATEAKNCKGDLIRINGENHFFESILYHPVFPVFTFAVDSTMLIIFIGASTPCCQGGGPQPLQDALCGYWFTTQGVGKGDAAFHVPVCGEYYNAFFTYFHDLDFTIYEIFCFNNFRNNFHC